MKRFLLIIILFLSFINVEAKTYYSPYTDYSDFQEEKIEESDIVSVKKERRYKFYQINKVIGKYLPLGKTSRLYPEIDETDFYQTEFSNWLPHKPAYEINRVIETKKGYSYRDLIKTKYLQFYDLQGGNGLVISELEIFNKDNKIDYQVIDQNQDFINRLKDGNYYDNSNLIANGSKIIIDLQGEYELDDLTVKIYLYDETDTQKNIKIYYTGSEKFANDIVASLSYIHCFTYSDVNEIEPFIYTSKDLYKYSSKYTSKIYSLEYPLEKEGRKITKETLYRYNDIVYRHYRNDKTYLDGYYLKSDGFIKDTSQFKDFYSYRIRDKVVLDDNLIFKDKKRTIKDLVLETTTDDIKIESDFDINKNGKYQIKFILPFKSITKTATVDILKNNLNELNSKLNSVEEELKENKDEYNKKVDEIKKLQDVIKNLKDNDVDDEKLNKYRKQLKDLKNDVDGIVTKINNLEKKKKGYNNELKKIVNNNKIDTNLIKNILWLIILLLVILIGCYLIRMKKMSYQK